MTVPADPLDSASPARRIVLLAGPSGSGKGRLGHLVGLPVVALDDFYRDHTEPGLPERYRIIDWDHPLTWDRDGALAALADLARSGTARVPIYSIPQSRRVGVRELSAGHSPLVLAEGIFAAELVAPLREAGLLADAIVLKRPRPVVFALRLARDLRESRKPLPALVARGWGLTRSQRADVDRWAAAGMRPMGLKPAVAHVRRLGGAPPAAGRFRRSGRALEKAARTGHGRG